MQPSWRSAKTKLPRSRWVKVRVLWPDMPALAEWFLSLARAVDAYTGERRVPPVGLRMVDGEAVFVVEGEQLLSVWPESEEQLEERQ